MLAWVRHTDRLSPYTAIDAWRGRSSDAPRCEPGCGRTVARHNLCVAEADGEQIARMVLQQVFAQVEGWQKRTNEAPREVQPGSQLASDDAVTDYLQTSHVALGCLVGAVDHLYALRGLVETARMLSAHASFTLVRGAHENAATAVWLLSPDDQVERVRRRLSLALQDSYNANEIQQLIMAEPETEGSHEGSGPNPVDPDAEDVHQKRRSDVCERAGRVGLALSDIPRFPGYEKVVAAAGAHLGNEVMHRLVWKGCSGLAHGMQWSSMGLLEREEFEVDGQVVTVRLTTSWTTLASASRRAAEMIKEGFRLLDRARLVWR